jgi:tetratricopeptide (TPR) repeat protein
MLTDETVDRALAVLEKARETWRGDAELALDVATALLNGAVSRYRRNMTAVERRDFFVELHRSYAGLEAGTKRRGDLSAEAHINMALYFYLREDFLQAADHLELAIAASPESLELHHFAGTALGAAADRLRHTLEDGTRTLTQQGLQLIRRAVPHLEKACEPRDSSPDSFYNLGRCLYALGEYEKALEVFRKALRIEDSEEMNMLAALAAAKQARAWQGLAKTQSLMAEGKKQVLTKRAAQFMDAAIQYFRQALLRNETSPALHGNIGLAYMLRNQEHDVESALRHWQRMRAIAGAEMSKRYSEFTQIQSVEHASRVQFDDAEVACREVKVENWIATLPPQPASLHYVLEPVSEQHEWRLAATDERLKIALRLRDTIASGAAALARLEA